MKGKKNVCNKVIERIRDLETKNEIKLIWIEVKTKERKRVRLMSAESYKVSKNEC